MFHLVNRIDGAGLVANVVLAVGSASLVNGLIFLLNRSEKTLRIEPDFAPPGFVIGVVWLGLFAFMGMARWLILRSSGRDSPHHARLVTLLASFCAAYPFYTLGLSNTYIGLVGNIATLAAAVWVTVRVRSSSVLAAGLTFSIVPWVVFATVLVIEIIRLN